MPKKTTTPKKRPHSATKGGPKAMDVHVGNRLRMRRQMLGLSQMDLAAAVGLTFQQLQKYERGTNRVSAGRLYDFAQALGCKVDYFFDQFDARQKPQKFDYGFSNDNQGEHLDTGKWYDKETLELIRLYYTIPSRQIRRTAVKLIENMAAMQTPAAKRKAAA